MARYVVETPHTAEECLRNLDEISAKGDDTLSKFDFGCHSGVHTGFATIEAGNDTDVRRMLPTFLRDRARVVKVDKETIDQIRSYHKM
jgi:hypothetical protein